MYIFLFCMHLVMILFLLSLSFFVSLSNLHVISLFYFLCFYIVCLLMLLLLVCRLFLFCSEYCVLWLFLFIVNLLVLNSHVFYLFWNICTYSFCNRLFAKIRNPNQLELIDFNRLMGIHFNRQIHRLSCFFRITSYDTRSISLSLSNLLFSPLCLVDRQFPIDWKQNDTSNRNVQIEIDR